MLLCISERTRADLVGFSAAAARKATVSWLGPGMMPKDSFDEQSNGVLLLVGGAKHKNNELAAAAIAVDVPRWCKSVIGVGVSQEVRTVTESSLGAENCRWFERISDEALIDLYREAEYFMLLGRDEGFGLPYIEALSAGCTVIAVDQPLTRELLDEAAVLVKFGTPAEISTQLRSIRVPSPDLRRHRADQFDWELFVEGVRSALSNASSPKP
ncbi:glycosyltransferase [Plantibacter sp. Mn2098]|uniref:glycosyltransferase n=1 Tax=Plantibacter sp. Mn2098 TaxID=3395266 RepID=UPI003BE8FE5D